MICHRRPSGQVTAVVLALAEEPATWRYGYELCQRLDLAAGELYKALMRLADRGLLETSWEPVVADGRPRQLYRLSGSGVALAEELAAEPPLPPRAAWAVGALGRWPWLEGT